MTPRRPRPLDAVLIGALVLIVAAVVFLQLHLGGDKTSATSSPTATPSYLQTSSVGSAAASPSGVPSSTPVPSTSPGASGAPSTTVAPGTNAPGPGALASSLAAQAQSLAAQQPATFRVATLNVLGSSHTGGHGDEASRPSGVWRMARSVSVLSQHDVQVVGLQEFETIQAQTFLDQTHGAWQIYPGVSGDTRDAIAWRTDTFEVVQEQVVQIPYFNGSNVDMPVVLLRDRKTGKQVYFFNVHNSADTYKYHHQQGNRTSAMSREVQLIKQMHGYKIPVIFTGDLNERADAYCLLTADAPLHAAYGGGNAATGCQAPSIGGSVPIDWIFGTPDVTFSDPVMDHSSLVRAATDHPFYAATVTLR
ncbi:endonuclease/exonuclease/phosphatase family protein [Nocardioides sp. Iso805N]|uniref:endonuclease/exonuclease/phosphatase family protein n=1 Tax=Nocardioides sp. Iso805N TaxID=1283287 RepID=UPI0003AB1330|nr:endonuclease/exonuclease/phosphatase family protein [Nocardioides sp. Iso805N]